MSFSFDRVSVLCVNKDWSSAQRDLTSLFGPEEFTDEHSWSQFNWNGTIVSLSDEPEPPQWMLMAKTYDLEAAVEFAVQQGWELTHRNSGDHEERAVMTSSSGISVIIYKPSNV